MKFFIQKWRGQQKGGSSDNKTEKISNVAGAVDETNALPAQLEAMEISKRSHPRWYRGLTMPARRVRLYRSICDDPGAQALPGDETPGKGIICWNFG